MDLNKFFSHQQKLNKTLIIDKNLNTYKVTARKNLTLQVKLNDLANETKCFVYWQHKDTKICKETVLTKYIDCLSYILTIGLDRNYSELKSVLVKPNDYCLCDQFLNLLIDVNDLIISPSLDHYNTLLEDYVSLGISLGFSIDLITERFLNKDICRLAL